MAKSNKQETKVAAASKPVAPIANKSNQGKQSLFAPKQNLPQGKYMFDQINYILMFVGLVVLVIGFVAMSGGSDVDPNVFSKAEKYSTRRITIAPMLLIIGFIIEGIAIFYKAKPSSETNSSL